MVKINIGSNRQGSHKKDNRLCLIIYTDLFTDEERTVARDRLKGYGFRLWKE